MDPAFPTRGIIPNTTNRPRPATGQRPIFTLTDEDHFFLSTGVHSIETSRTTLTISRDPRLAQYNTALNSARRTLEQIRSLESIPSLRPPPTMSTPNTNPAPVRAPGLSLAESLAIERDQEQRRLEAVGEQNVRRLLRAGGVAPRAQVTRTSMGFGMPGRTPREIAASAVLEELAWVDEQQERLRETKAEQKRKEDEEKLKEEVLAMRERQKEILEKKRIEDGEKEAEGTEPRATGEEKKKKGKKGKNGKTAQSKDINGAAQATDKDANSNGDLHVASASAVAGIDKVDNPVDNPPNGTLASANLIDHGHSTSVAGPSTTSITSPITPANPSNPIPSSATPKPQAPITDPATRRQKYESNAAYAEFMPHFDNFDNDEEFEAFCETMRRLDTEGDESEEEE